MEDLPLGRTAALVPELAVKDLSFGRTTLMMIDDDDDGWWWCDGGGGDYDDDDDINRS